MTSGKASKDEGKEGSVKKAANRKPDFEVTLVGGDRYESLEAALEAGLDDLNRIGQNSSHRTPV